MEIVFEEISELKIKFGHILSFLFHSAGIQLANISYQLIESSFLDMLEDNKFEEFLSLSDLDVLNTLFPGAEVKRLFDDKDIGEIYWSGIQYMNIFLNYRIPLRQLFLFCPLEEMVTKYQIYHEMNEIELCKDFYDNNYNNVSILKYFRNMRKVNIRQLSLLTNIPEPTLKYLEADNKKLLGASYKTIASIKTTLNISGTFLKEKSDFLPITYRLLNNKAFVTNISVVIGKYFTHSSYPNLQIKFYKDTQLDKGQAYLFVNGGSYIQIDNKTIFIDDVVFKMILSKTIDEYLNDYLNDKLVF